MKTVILAALVGLISWQALASENFVTLPCGKRVAGTTYDKAKTDWSHLNANGNQPQLMQSKPRHSVKAQATDNNG